MPTQFTFDSKTRKFSTRMKSRASGLAQRIARLGVSMVREEMKRPKSGRTYLVRVGGGRRRVHIASAPGEPPAILSGRLFRETKASKVSLGVWDFGTLVKYGRILEEGLGRIKKRPVYAKVFRKLQPIFRRELRSLLK